LAPKTLPRRTEIKDFIFYQLDPRGRLIGCEFLMALQLQASFALTKRDDQQRKPIKLKIRI
jgi:hypothetical protein